MIKILLIIVGSILSVASIITVIISLKITPKNLRGFYGKMFWAIAIIGLIGGVLAIISGVLL